MNDSKNIIVTVDTCKAGINVRRPSWSSMKKNYPGENIKTIDFYSMISDGLVKDIGPEGSHKYENSCAIRMSRALNYSGVSLGKQPDDRYIRSHKDKKYYWTCVRDLNKELENLFKCPDIKLVYNVKMPDATIDDTNSETYIKNHHELYTQRKAQAENSFLSQIKHKNGIISFIVDGWGDAEGHFTLWEQGKLLYAQNHNNKDESTYYIWMVYIDNYKVVQTTEIRYWELK